MLETIEAGYPRELEAEKFVRSRPGILLVLNSRLDVEQARRTLASDFNVMTAHSYRSALRELSLHSIDAIVCDEHLTDGDWKDLVSRLVTSAQQPRVVVLATQLDARFWAEALSLGAYDVLLRPLNDDELARIAMQACGAGFCSFRSSGD